MNKYNESKERINIIVGMRLKKRRIMLGMSQQELSEAINLSVKQIQKYENATTPIAGSILYFFAKILNVSIEYFLDMTKTTEVSEDYLFGTQDNNSLVNNIIAEDKAEYLVPLKYDTEKEVSYLVEGFTEIQNPHIRQKIVELIKSIVASQGNQI
ncbi:MULTISPECIES: helix-turn-helix domain-containing protein [unclassified Candidatus Tisiphia]|jgi:transcriptional regulator with XRE-family HTH domain|uniref:helix-turn-helix domain-containing protein n=1 Tax=unclassified Candidatus Tisiphia TaxID=2996318 RepID=UPI001E7D8D75|nr:MAG: helix-turn-helix domain-containing protein [Rickettsia endosymbiont of Cimex lectularius]